MKKWFLHILLLAGLFGVLTTSCSQEEGLELQVSTEKVPVTFTIAMGTSSSRSRTGEDEKWDDYEDSEVGNEFENMIDPTQLYVELILTFIENGVTKESTITVNPISCWKLNQTNQANQVDLYQFVGEVNVNIKESTTFQKAKVMVYANNGGKNETFATDYDDNTGMLVGYIPMWGVKTLENFNLTPGSQSDFGSISLLRAMAKIEVTWESTSNFAKNGYSISSVGLNKYNTQGNMKPSFSDPEPENTTDYQINAINSLVSPSDASGLLFCQASTNSYVIYIPEYDNVNNNEGITEQDSNDVLISLDVKDSDNNSVLLDPANEKRSPTIRMKNLDLVRNHWYKYNIEDIVIDTDVTFTLQYQVMEWTPINNGSLTFGGESGAIHNPNQSN